MNTWRKLSSFVSASLFLGLLSAHVQASAPILIYSDNFESGAGNWSNVTTGDNNNWARDSGGTTSSGTGPLTGANGSLYYMYFETSSGYAYTAGDTAILQGPSITHDNVHVEFQYHMYGADIGTLAVDVLSGGSWVNDVWFVSGQQHTSNSAAYTAVNVDLSAYSVSQIRFRATAAGSYRGDIAIDDIAIWGNTAGPTAPVFNDDPIAKSDARQDQSYNDSIAGDASDANGDALFFSKISGPAWLYVASDGALSGIPLSSDVGINSFVVEVSDGSLSSRTTLNVAVNDNSTPIILSSSDFELDLGDWSNVTSGDNKEWTRDSGGTPSVGTGPASGANGSQYYMYLETSSGSAYTAGDTAILQGPSISGSDISLRFQYHMYGANIGTLAVDVLSVGSWIHDVWSISGQQQQTNSEAYSEVEVDLSGYSVSGVRFRATAEGGYTGDTAIDNVELFIPPSPSGPVAPVFLSDPLIKSSAIINQPYSDSIADDAADANGDALVFSKISGPDWLYVGSDGALAGTPSGSDIGNNSFVVSVSDGGLSSNAALNIYVNDGAFSISIFPYASGHGQDGGANNGWVVDGVIDEFWDRTAYQDNVVIRRYTSLDFTKRSNILGAFEFLFPQNIINNAANVVVESATLELDIDGSASGWVYFHGYLGNGSIELSDFVNNNLIAEDTSPSQRITVDVTAYVNSIVGQSDYVGFLLKPWDYRQDMYVGLWNGTPHPAFGRISGQISRMIINYRIE